MPNCTSIDSAESFKLDRVQMQKLRKEPATSIAVRQCLIHTHESLTPFGLQSFFIPTIKRLQQYYNSKPVNPTLTSLEEGASSRIYTKHRPSSPGGRKSQGDKPNMLMKSPSMPDLCLTEPDLSLTECNCQSKNWSDWHLNLLTEASTKTHPDEPKTCGGEREGEIPHKGCWRSTLDLIWLPPSVKDLYI